MYNTIDIVLLLSEWDSNGSCLVCRCQGRSMHNTGCVMDLALAERAFPTQVERDAARKRLVTVIETMPAPPPMSTEPPVPEE